MVQTIYTLTKPNGGGGGVGGVGGRTNKDVTSHHESSPSNLQKNTPLTLTLPLSPSNVDSCNINGSNTASIHLTEKSNKINSSTFYPLQNAHVTYTLPKNIGGKTSLNSTIASVVSKVPSVISIPVGVDNNNADATTTMTTSKNTTLPKILRVKKDHVNRNLLKQQQPVVSQCNMPSYPSSQHSTNTTTTSAGNAKHLPVCTTSKNCLNPKEHFLPNDTSLDDDYLSECENCKIAQSAKYYLHADELNDKRPETMTLQRKSMEESKEQETEPAYYRNSHTLPTNHKKNG